MSGKKCEHGYPLGGICQLCQGLRRAVDAGYLSPENGPKDASASDDDKPSPGPWRADSIDSIMDANNEPVVYDEGGMKRSDARLIAAAPQMLELLRRVNEAPYNGEVDDQIYELIKGIDGKKP